MENDTTVLSAAEAAEYGEFCRNRREAETAFLLRRLVAVGERGAGREDLRCLLAGARRLGLHAVSLSPTAAAFLKRDRDRTAPALRITVGGTGESLIPIKKTEAKKAVRAGASEVVLVPCISALRGGNFAYLKREFRSVRRAVRNRALIVSFDDRLVGETELALGVRAAIAAGVDGVAVRGEPAAVAFCLDRAGNRLFVEASCVENAAQLQLLVKAGAVRAETACAEKIAGELYRSTAESGAKTGTQDAADIPK